MKELSAFLKEVRAMSPPEFLIENLLIVGRYMVLVGRTGIGKSLLAIHLMLCFASGKPWLGFTVKPCPCLYLNFELSDLQLAPRLEKQLPSFSLQYEPKVESRFFQPVKNLGELATLINAEPRPKVVIVDSFRQIYGGKINDNDKVAEWVTGVQQILDRSKVGLVIIQNTGKVKPYLDTGSLDESIGASELANRAITVMVATPRQLRTQHGHFSTKASDEVELHIPKYGCSAQELQMKQLKLNRQTLLFEAK